LKKKKSQQINLEKWRAATLVILLAYSALHEFYLYLYTPPGPKKVVVWI